MRNTEQRFHGDIVRIASDLISAYSLKFRLEIQALRDPLLRWLDFRLRFIEPVPRAVLLSNKFPIRLPAPVETGLHDIKEMIQAGEDINPFQSKGLIQFNDVSGKNRAKRTDLLWADWGITHLHVTDKKTAQGKYFSERACSNGESWLLFCLVVGDAVGFIDIRRHDDDALFSDQSLIKTVSDSWPHYMEPFRMKGILPGTAGYSNNDISSMRRSGISIATRIDGELYANAGITSASTSTVVSQMRMRIVRWIKDLATIADDPNGQFQATARSLGIKEPEFCLSLTPKGLAVYEKKSNVAFVFDKLLEDKNAAWFNETARLIFPDWALSHMLANIAV